MRRITPLLLSLVLLFNSCVHVFASPKGNPLDEHREYYSLLRQGFANKENDSWDSNADYVWEKKPSFIFWSNDYRTVRVYNMPHLFNTNVNNNFFNSSVKMISDARKICGSSSKMGTAVGKAALKILKSELKKQTKGTKEAKAIADFLGTDEDVAIDSFVSAFGMSCVSQILHGTTVAGVLLDMFKPLAPAAGAFVSFLDVASFFTTRAALADERIKNNAIALSTVYRILMNDPQRILDSNVLVSAIDDRDFTALLRWNAFRRDDGAWCDFQYIGGLKCAPRGRDYKNGEVISKCSIICNQIMKDGKINIKALKSNEENSGNFICRLVGIKNSNAEEKVEEVD